MLGELNAIRAHVGAPPLALEIAQSKTNTAVLPHLLAAEQGGSGAWEKLCLGLVAGWNVEGAIIAGGSFIDRGFGTATDGSSLLEAFLNEPSGRVALLDRKATRIALGVLVDPPSKSVAAAISVYKTFADDDHRERVAQMVRRIGRERANAGLDPGIHITPLDVLDAEADRVRTEGKDPMAAFAVALKNAVARTKRSMRGVVWAVTDLDVMPLPKELLTKPNEPFALQVTHRRVEGAAWGEWIVMLLWVD